MVKIYSILFIADGDNYEQIVINYEQRIRLDVTGIYVILSSLRKL